MTGTKQSKLPRRMIQHCGLSLKPQATGLWSLIRKEADKFLRLYVLRREWKIPVNCMETPDSLNSLHIMHNKTGLPTLFTCRARLFPSHVSLPSTLSPPHSPFIHPRYYHCNSFVSTHQQNSSPVSRHPEARQTCQTPAQATPERALLHEDDRGLLLLITLKCHRCLTKRNSRLLQPLTR